MPARALVTLNLPFNSTTGGKNSGCGSHKMEEILNVSLSYTTGAFFVVISSSASKIGNMITIIFNSSSLNLCLKINFKSFK